MSATPSTAPPETEPADLPAVLGATFLVRFAFGISIAVFASYLEGHMVGLAPGEFGTVGLVSSTASIAEFSTVLLSGIAADRYGRWRILGIGMGVAAVMTLLFTVTRSPVPIASINFVFGIASGAILAASLALVADEAPRARRGYDMGRFDAVNLAGWIVGYAAGLIALGVLPNSWLAGIFPVGTLALLIGLLYAHHLRRRQVPVARVVRARRIPLGDIVRRRVVIVVAPWLVIYTLIGTALVFLGTAADGVGISPIYLGIAIGIGGLLLTLTQPAFGTLADRFGTTRLMMIGTGGFVVVLLGAILIASYGAPPFLIAIVAVGVVGALAYGPAALSALAELSRSISRATTMAVYTLCISLGMTIGLLASTQLWANFGVPGIDAFFAVLAGALVVLAGLRYWDDSVATAALTTPAQ
ncbi:MAG: MFS transporter [Thermoplasmata archaeon]